MEIFTPSTDERRLLVELLACELAGDPEVDVERLGRREVALELQLQRLVVWSGPHRIRLTVQGRNLAQHLAERMLDTRLVRAC